ncbi:MAG: hypothetical protein ACI976_002233 [Aureispira sp.]
MRDEDWEMASVKNTSVLGGRSIRQVQYSSSKSHPIVVLALDFGSFIKKRTKEEQSIPCC